MWNKKKTEQAVEKTEQAEQKTEQAEQKKKSVRNLIVVTEKMTPRLREFLDDYELYTYEITDNMEDAKISMLTQNGDIRIALIESGMGLFTTLAMRAEITDLLGMCDSDNKAVTVFYTNDAIRFDNKKLDKILNVDWVKFDGTPSVAAKLLGYNETYVKYKNNQRETDSNGLGFRGTDVKDLIGSGDNKSDMEKIERVIESVMIEHGDAEDAEFIPRYNVAY